MRYLAILAATLLLTACGDEPLDPPDITGDFAAPINPQPQYFLTVQGKIAPQLKRQVHLKIIANYYTTNKDCNYAIDTDRNISYQHFDKITTINPDAKGNYQSKIPLDYYLPGLCGWKLNYIGYKTQTDKLDEYLYGIAFFSDSGIIPKNTIGEDNWLCTKEKICTVQSGTPLQTELDQSGYLSPKNNYLVNINFKADYDDNSKCLFGKLCLPHWL